MCPNYFELPACPPGQIRSTVTCECSTFGVTAGGTSSGSTSSGSTNLPSTPNWLDTVTVLVDNATNVADTVGGLLNGGNGQQSPVIIQQPAPVVEPKGDSNTMILVIIGVFVLIAMIVGIILMIRNKNKN